MSLGIITLQQIGVDISLELNLMQSFHMHMHDNYERVEVEL